MIQLIWQVLRGRDSARANGLCLYMKSPKEFPSQMHILRKLLGESRSEAT